jgi:hypothetical protein
VCLIVKGLCSSTDETVPSCATVTGATARHPASDKTSMQKFTLQSAQGLVQFISNSPFISWLSVFGLRREAYVLGVVEFGIAALLAAGAFSPILSAVGSLMLRSVDRV